jgi:restriction system protein
MGLSVQLTQASHDGGVDLHVIDPTPIRGGRYIVQAKRYQGGVGEPIMRDLYGTLLHSGAVKAILITTGYFTEGAVAFAYGKPIELVDGNALGRLIDQYQLHHEFSGDAISPNSADPLSSVTADEL